MCSCLFVDQVGRLNVERSVALGRDLADHALDVVNAVLLDRAAVELVEVLAGGTHVDVEHIHIGVRVLVADEHRVLGGVHAADLGAVLLAAARRDRSGSRRTARTRWCADACSSEGRSSVPPVGPAAFIRRSSSSEVITSLRLGVGELVVLCPA